ncbi:hypothetical protein O181_128099 [Austropuccinia psidii MF-1]|uniref:Retroviral polymerase SH3-like domain-containing protein n=1 Tax=Austropuccinia psidii MF-1 TaxID=1389203 RepID=A0A9Q3KZA3_9BASI|nr:hypothetical protein [Austropuccinia psidii MF-1]
MFVSCSVIYNLKRQHNWKLALPGQEGVLLGFENDGTAYRILRLDELKAVATRNATFNERIFLSVPGETNTSLWTIDRINEQISTFNIHTDMQRESNPFIDLEHSVQTASHLETSNEEPNN